MFVLICLILAFIFILLCCVLIDLSSVICYNRDILHIINLIAYLWYASFYYLFWAFNFFQQWLFSFYIMHSDGQVFPISSNTKNGNWYAVDRMCAISTPCKVLRQRRIEWTNKKKKFISGYYLYLSIYVSSLHISLFLYIYIFYIYICISVSIHIRLCYSCLRLSIDLPRCAYRLAVYKHWH